MSRDRKWLLTHTGRKAYPLAMTTDMVDVRDIAHSLAMQCRYNGYTRRFYSVAEHSVLMARHVYGEGVQIARCMLMHDAAEAYISDIPRPLKYALAFRQNDGSYVSIKEAENAIERVISERFDLPYPFPKIVAEWDERILTTERNALLPWHTDWDCSSDPLPVKIECWSPEQAESQFLYTFHALWSGKWK